MTAGGVRAVRPGDRVRVNYTGRFADGTVFDSSEGNDPLEFTVGADEVISGFDAAVVGMQPEQTRSVTVLPEEAYGPHVEEMVAEVERQLIPDDERLQVGGFLEVTLEDGQTLEVQVVALDETTATLDANHPLAGKTLEFDIELLSID